MVPIYKVFIDEKILYTTIVNFKKKGIIGFPKFVDGYYLHLITEREIVGYVNGNYIYTITKT